MFVFVRLVGIRECVCVYLSTKYRAVRNKTELGRNNRRIYVLNKSSGMKGHQVRDGSNFASFPLYGITKTH